MTNQTEWKGEETVYEDLEPITFPIRVRGHRYLVREASEDAARKYRNAGAQSARMQDGKVVGVVGIADVQSLLVSLCTYIPDADGRIRMLKGDDRPDPRYLVSLDKVRSWSSKTVQDLFEKIKKISDLGEEDTEESLSKTIQDATERLNKLQAGKPSAEEEGRKNSESGMETSSTSDENFINRSTKSWDGLVP